jgi:hypothetical protein
MCKLDINLGMVEKKEKKGEKEESQSALVAFKKQTKNKQKHFVLLF